MALACAIFLALSPARSVELQDVEKTLAAAKSALANGDFEQARTQYEALLTLAPAHPALQVGLAQSLAGLARFSDAARVYDELVDEGFGARILNDPALEKLSAQQDISALKAKAVSQTTVIAPAVAAFTLPENGFIPEGLAFDPQTGRFFVSSTYLRKIISRDPTGRFTDFAPSRDHGLLQALGMKVDPVRSRLVVCTGADDRRLVGFKRADVGRSAVFIYNLVTARFVRSVWVDSPGVHLFNDVAIAPDGTAYITDSDEGRIYRLRVDAVRLEPVSAPGAFVYPNGIDIDASANLLYVGDFRGLFTLDLRTGSVARMPRPNAVSTVAIDGLYLHDDALIGVQNSVQPPRVVAYFLSRDHRSIDGAEVLERADPRMSEPTEGVVVGDDLYFVAVSNQSSVDADGRIKDGEIRTPSVILRLRLPATIRRSK